jgi:hypothetical protein
MGEKCGIIEYICGCLNYATSITSASLVQNVSLPNTPELYEVGNKLGLPAHSSVSVSRQSEMLYFFVPLKLLSIICSKEKYQCVFWMEINPPSSNYGSLPRCTINDIPLGKTRMVWGCSLSEKELYFTQKQSPTTSSFSIKIDSA